MLIDALSLAQDRIEKQELKHREVTARVKALQVAQETHSNSATLHSTVPKTATLPASYSPSSQVPPKSPDTLLNKLQIKQLTAEFNQHNGTHHILAKLLQQQGISPTHTAQVWLLDQLTKKAN
jgi:hypothetical protein